MSKYVLRNENDLFRVLMSGDDAFDFSELRFERFPRIELRSSEPIDIFRLTDAVSAVERACRRLYTLFAYGKSGRRLSKEECARVRPSIEQSNDRRLLAFDLTNVANYTLQALRSNIAQSHAAPSPTNLFDMWLAVLKDKLPTLTQANATKVMTRGLLAATVCVGGVASWYISSQHALLSQKEENRHVEELFKLSNVQLAANNGGETVVQKQTRLDAEKAIANADARNGKFLSNLHNGDPLVRFISNEVEKLRPALLEVASSTGTLDINGVRFTGYQAHKAAREIRKNVKNGISPWTTTLIMS